MKFKPEWGRHNIMVIAAFRYCLGRRTYIVSDCVDWLIAYWDEIDKNTKQIILEEIKEAFLKDHVGDECDAEDWKRVLALE